MDSNDPNSVTRNTRLAADFTHVLIVGHSQINKVVVAKIVERSGLRPLSETPETADKTLHEKLPATIILDGGASNRDCDGLIDKIVAIRRAAGGDVPRIIMLSNQNGSVRSLSLSSAIDAVVAKPITPERLQPVVMELAARGRR